MQSQNLPSDDLAQVHDWFADDVDLIEGLDLNEIDLAAGVHRRFAQEHGRDTAGPIALALEVVLRRLAVEQSASVVPTGAAIRHAITRLSRIAASQEATESQLPRMES